MVVKVADVLVEHRRSQRRQRCRRATATAQRRRGQVQPLEMACDRAQNRHRVGTFEVAARKGQLERADIAARPVYLGMAMDGAETLRFNPQSLLANLPLAAAT